MYTVDSKLRSLLDDLQIEVESSAEPFDPDKQIQACSIDLRVGSVFWKPRHHADRPLNWAYLRRRIVDLRRISRLERSRRFYWRRTELQPSESIDLKPGEFILARTCEEFTIPESYAGKIEGRSSFARLGLAVHCSGDFINPGYRGRMPLELINHSRRTLRIPAHIPICQLILITLDSRPDRIYPEREPHVKYMNDDGGPSLWWMDRLIQELQTKVAKAQPVLEIQEKILTRIGTREPDLILRFEHFLEDMPVGDFSNVQSLLESFARSEDRHRRRVWWTRQSAIWIAGVLATTAVAMLFNPPYGFPHWMSWIAAIMAAPIGLVASRYSSGEHFGEKEMQLAEVHAE